LGRKKRGREGSLFLFARLELSSNTDTSLESDFSFLVICEFKKETIVLFFLTINDGEATNEREKEGSMCHCVVHVASADTRGATAGPTRSGERRIRRHPLRQRHLTMVNVLRGETINLFFFAFKSLPYRSTNTFSDALFFLLLLW
jgi:hypothetical protein